MVNITKFTAKYVRESYVEIEADTLEEASKIAGEYPDVDENADFWDFVDIRESEEQ